jgi:hypothetical protein
MANELITIEQSNLMDLFTKPNSLDGILTKVEAIVNEYPALTAETEKERKEISSLAYKIARTKTYIDNHGKDVAAELKKLPKIVDANRKQAREFLDGLRDRIRQPLTEFEEKEKAIEAERQRKIQEAEEAKRRAAEERAAKEREEQLREQIRKEEAAKAQAEKEKAIEQAKEEVKRKGAEELKKMQDLLKKEEQKESGAEKLASPEELEAIEAQRELQRMREDELEKARQKQEELKRREILEKERVAKEVALKKQDPNHQSAIHADVLFGLTFFCGLDQEQAQSVLDNIKSGNIDHLKIEY